MSVRFTRVLVSKRLGQFFSVGLVGLICDTLVLVALVELFRLSPVVAKLGSAEAAIVLMFVINDRWTFRGMGEADPFSVLRRLLRSNLVRTGGVLVALTTLYVCHEYLGIWYFVANVIGVGTGFLVNYVFETLVTWRAHSTVSTTHD